MHVSTAVCLFDDRLCEYWGGSYMLKYNIDFNSLENKTVDNFAPQYLIQQIL